MTTNPANRIKKLRHSFTEKEIDGVLISQAENRRYLSGFDGSAGYLLITVRDAVLATDFRYLEQAARQSPDYRIFPVTGNTSEWFLRLVTETGVKRLGFESGQVSVSLYRQLSDILSKDRVELAPLDGLVEGLRAIKEPEEIELITRAAELTDRAFTDIESRLQPGMTEKEIAWQLEKFMRENGSQNMPFEIIVASGPNSALPHAKPSERRIQTGEPVLFDLGARIEGYSGDLSRTICPGTPNKTFKKVYDIVLGAQLAAIAMIKEGISGNEADSLARTVIEEAGHGDKFGHSLGHGVGLAPHELPRLGPNSTETLAAGMVFSIEPGIYISGWGGVRIEDLAVMENDKIRLISQARK